MPGGQDKATAIATLKNSVEDGRYQPTHELQTLKDLIFPVKEFVDILRTSSNKLWPTVPNQTPVRCTSRRPRNDRQPAPLSSVACSRLPPARRW